MEKEKKQETKLRRPVKSRSDIEMLRERKYERESYYGNRNICDTHEDGA